jgi:hypothetical protein
MAESPQPAGPRTMLDYARAYAARGWSVVPVRPGEKIPAVPWAQFQHRRASDAELQAWFADGRMGIGLVTGAISGFFVADFDGDEGHATHAKIGAQLAGPTSLTGGGGLHVLIRYPGVRIPTRKGLLPGMDIRGDGGFIVAPPSSHASGSAYQWDVDNHPDDVALNDAPRWFVDHITADAPPGPGHAAEVTRGANSLGLDLGTVTDGREAYMRNTILAVCRDLSDKLGRLPTAEELTAEAWPQYAAKVDFSRPGRGPDEFAAKVAYTLARAAKGGIRGFAVPLDGPATGGSEQPKHKRGIQLLSLEEVEALPPPTFLIDGLIPEKSIVIPYGPPKAGKTFVVLSMGLHIAAGQAWMGRKVHGGGVVYIAGEGVGGLSLRLRAMRQAYGLTGALPFWVVPRAVSFRDPNAVAALLEAIRETVLDEPIALVVLDTLARAMPGVDENSAEEVGAVVAACDELKFALGCTVMPIHHAGKDLERGLRGSSAIHGALDASLQITGAGDRVTVKNDNQKDAEPAQPFMLEMRKVELGLGHSSIVPFLAEGEEPETKPRGRPSRATGDALIARQALEAALAAGEPPPAHLNLPASLLVIHEGAWQRETVSRLPKVMGLTGRAEAQEKERQRKQAARARIAACKAGVAIVMEGYAWLP